MFDDVQRRAHDAHLCGRAMREKQNGGERTGCDLFTHTHAHAVYVYRFDARKCNIQAESVCICYPLGWKQKPINRMVPFFTNITETNRMFHYRCGGGTMRPDDGRREHAQYVYTHSHVVVHGVWRALVKHPTQQRNTHATALRYCTNCVGLCATRFAIVSRISRLDKSRVFG